MSPTLMRIRCYECDHAVITVNNPLKLIGNAMMLVHFTETGHSHIRAITPDDIMQDYFVIPEQPARYSDLGEEK